MSRPSAGPWIYTNGRHVYGGPHSDSKHANGRQCIAEVMSGKVDVVDDEAKANARLIAAAPDLLDALREIAAAMREDNGTFRKRGGTRAGFALVTAEAALAKVGGPTP